MGDKVFNKKGYSKKREKKILNPGVSVVGAIVGNDQLWLFDVAVSCQPFYAVVLGALLQMLI